MDFFSRRKGLKPKKIVQIDSMDNELRTRLWNELKKYYWDNTPTNLTYGGEHISFTNGVDGIVNRLWGDHMKSPLHSRGTLNNTYKRLWEYFLECKWNEVYDFVEFILNVDPNPGRVKTFCESCNTVLKEESSAYRLIDNQFMPVTSDEELAEVENVLQSSEKISSVHTHIRTAIKHLSDKKSPDYRNSIKESISAVEAICALIVSDEKATLGKALNRIEKNNIILLNPNLKEGFKHLYDYTSEDDGIRHSLMGEHNLDEEDARFMLVSCSAFINYLIAKSNKTGIKFK